MAEKIIEIDISREMRDSYLEYAMSVIIGRALPDVRDGLKPVHRRALFSMSEQGNDYNKAYRKSARVVGDVIGKYHPHGDAAAYDTIVRLTQEFSMRYPLVDGQGNFGSVDGDSAAAMRYTEIRMQRITHEMLTDLDKDTVDFVPNYDESLQEPVVLPTKIPNLLVNGSTGIAVGMACNIPPHNLTEVMNALLHYIDHQENTTLGDLMEHLHGPDFPTGGIIMGRSGIYSAYQTGRGIIVVRAKTHFEKEPGGADSIIVTELPFMTNKANMIEKIAALVREKKLEGISDLRDESDRKGMRIYIQVKRHENPEVVLSSLFKHTAMQSSFGIIMLAIVDQQPKVLPMMTTLRLFLDHRISVVTRRIQYDLKQAEAKAHILEGLTIALANLDAVIELIRRAENGAAAKVELVEKYELSEKQAQAILDMRLQRLTGLEQDKIRTDFENLLKQIEEYKKILADEKLILGIIREECVEIRDKYGDVRRTEISEEDSSISIEELITREDMAVTISRSGYIKRCSVSEYRLQRRGGKGRIGMSMKDEDFVEKMFVASTHDHLLIFTTFGQVFSMKVYQLPQAGPASKGKAMINLLPLRPDERVCAYLNVPEFSEDKYVLMCTANGICKKTNLHAFRKVRVNGIRAITLDENDTVFSVQLTDGDQQIFFATQQGMSLRFHEKQIRAMGREARGVIGIRMKEDDRVVTMEVLQGTGAILTVTENGYGKKTLTDDYPLSKNRGNQGVRAIKTSERNGLVVGALEIGDNFQVLLVTKLGQMIRIKTDQIPVIGRITQGVRLFTLDPEEKVIDIARFVEEEAEVEEGTDSLNDTAVSSSEDQKDLNTDSPPEDDEGSETLPED
ncbi:MAG: DNA gyrase subunit A [SAR324 cluster bacterium]|nr:DNA gyrase subunit A [SAR324 cluster bacterium]